MASTVLCVSTSFNHFATFIAACVSRLNIHTPGPSCYGPALLPEPAPGCSEGSVDTLTHAALRCPPLVFPALRLSAAPLCVCSSSQSGPPARFSLFRDVLGSGSHSNPPGSPDNLGVAPCAFALCILRRSFSAQISHSSSVTWGSPSLVILVTSTAIANHYSAALAICSNQSLLFILSNSCK